MRDSKKVPTICASLGCAQRHDHNETRVTQDCSITKIRTPRLTHSAFRSGAENTAFMGKVLTDKLFELRMDYKRNQIPSQLGVPYDLLEASDPEPALIKLVLRHRHKSRRPLHSTKT
ncbi:TPA: hypothetical protein ACH3X2_014185 [Trebouxia sp. C0005]